MREHRIALTGEHLCTCATGPGSAPRSAERRRHTCGIPCRSVPEQAGPAPCNTEAPAGSPHSTPVQTVRRVIIVSGYAATPQDQWFPWLRAGLLSEGVDATAIVQVQPNAGHFLAADGVTVLPMVLELLRRRS